MNKNKGRIIISPVDKFVKGNPVNGIQVVDELFIYRNQYLPPSHLLFFPPSSFYVPKPLYPMEEDDQKELQLLPTPHSIASSSSHMSSQPLNTSSRYRASPSDQYEGPSLDLQLSISLRAIQAQPSCVLTGSICEFGGVKSETSRVQALKWQASEQIRLAAIEKAYAERVRDLTRREMELAQSEFARARHMWERAREEVERAERMRERATREIDSTCMEITCQSCRQIFRP